jgi:hypothetical protein
MTIQCLRSLPRGDRVHRPYQTVREHILKTFFLLYGGCTEQSGARAAAGGGERQNIIRLHGAARRYAEQSFDIVGTTPRGAAQYYDIVAVRRRPLPPAATRAPLCSVHPPL